MGGRTMPDKCSHGAIRDWGDFGPEDGAPEFCTVCDAPPSRVEGDDGRSQGIEAALLNLVNRIEGEHYKDCHSHIKCSCVWRAKDRARAALEGGRS